MKHGKIDANQAEIVEALRRCGASVVSLADMGGGCPDLLIGYRGVTYLAEIKTARGQLNELQRQWHAGWRGFPVLILRSVDDAAKALGLYLAQGKNDKPNPQG